MHNITSIKVSIIISQKKHCPTSNLLYADLHTIDDSQLYQSTMQDGDTYGLD